MALKKKKIVSIVGARPQFVKLAPLAARLKKTCRHIIIHSGQHYDYNLSDSFFKQLKIPKPDNNLNIGSGEHGWQTGRILEKFEKAIIKIKPDMVLVYGDTNTTLAGGLAASKLHIPVGHVEAGLRSFNMAMPEEVNRKVTDHVSDLLFYPTPTARRNLLNEGIRKGLIKSGDLMYEILDKCLPLLENKKKILARFGLLKNDYFFITMHRAENSDYPERMKKFLDILKLIDRPKIFLAHPRTVKNMKRFKLNKRLSTINELIISKPLPYLETLTLMANSRAVMTDSGGIQKEAYFLGRPCYTMRPETEWVETVNSGANTLIDLSIPRARKALKKTSRLRGHSKYTINGKKPSEIISRTLIDFLNQSDE